MIRLSPPFLAGESVTFLRPAWNTDRYNNREADWSTATEYVAAGVGIAPGDTTEDLDGREQGITVDHTLYLTPDADGAFARGEFGDPLEVIATDDRVAFRGETHEIIGPVLMWVNPYSGARPGCVLRVTRTEG